MRIKPVVITTERKPIVASFEGNTSQKFVHPEQLGGILMINDGEQDVVVRLTPTLSFRIPPGDFMDEVVLPYVQIEVTASGPYRVYGRKV